MVGLAHRRAIPLEPEPVEVGDRGGNMLFARAGAVDIVDAEQERAAGAVRGIVRPNRAIGVAEGEFAGRAGERKGVGEGKSVSVRVARGGRRCLKKKKKYRIMR